MNGVAAVRPALVPAWVRKTFRGFAKEVLKRAICGAVELWDRVRYRGQVLPPARLRVRVGCFLSFLKASEYLRIGDEFVALFRRMTRLNSAHHMLDIGCGCGQIAVPLMDVLSEGRYEGFDPDAELIAWCQREIGGRNERFRFTHGDVANGLYNPEGRLEADGFRFPYEDGAFDVVLLKSVFTHMQRAGVRRYLAEIERMLAPGGVCVATFFLLNPASEAGIAAGRSWFRFPWESKGCKTMQKDAPEYLLAYEEVEILKLAAEAGLRVRADVRYGSWSGREGAESFQDVVALERRS